MAVNEYQAPQACVLLRRMETAVDQATTGYAVMSGSAKTAEAAGMMRRLSPGG